MCSDLREGGFGGFETFALSAVGSDELVDPIGESQKTTKTTFSQVRTAEWPRPAEMRVGQMDRRMQ